jgi:hypothetical protein
MVSRFLKLHCSSSLVGESSIIHCLNYQLSSPHLEAELSHLELSSFGTELNSTITRVSLYNLRTTTHRKLGSIVAPGISRRGQVT